jgi:hypothetical protein
MIIVRRALLVFAASKLGGPRFIRLLLSGSSFKPHRDHDDMSLVYKRTELISN